MRVSLVLPIVAVCSLVSPSSATDPFFASKRTDAPTRAPPSCETPCKDVRSPVCGTNGKTYDNYCLYSIAACKNKTLALAYTTACKAPPKTSDGDDNGDDDGDGDNDDGGNTEDDNDGGAQVPVTKTPATITSLVDFLIANNNDNDNVDNCDVYCTREYAPVCGSDRVLYANACLFSVAQCRAHGALSVRPRRECKTTS